MKKKKILHLISGLEIGGTETQLLRILPEMQKYHENFVCCVRGHGPIGIELEKNNVPVYYLNFQGFFDLLVIKRFYTVIKKIKPDVLTTYLIHADLYGRFFGKLFGIKKIISSKRGSLLQWEWLSSFDRLTKFMVDHYLVQTETAKRTWMKKLKLSESRFTIMPNGIDIKKFKPSVDRDDKRKSLNIATDSIVISCVARLRIGKGHDILLEAFEKVFKNYSKTDLLLIGDGEKEKELKIQIKNYTSKNNIHFLGNRQDVPDLLAISDVFILPTEGEGMSNAIIEAMIVGVSVITTEIPENKDLIEDKKNGILFPVNNSDSLSEKIQHLINDPGLRNILATNAQEEANERFDYEKVTKKLAEFYSKI